MNFLYRALPFFRALPCKPTFQIATLTPRKLTVSLRPVQWTVPSIRFRTFSSITLYKENPDSELILQEYDLFVRDHRLRTLSPEDFVNVLVALRKSKSMDAIENMNRVVQDFYQVHGASAVHGYNILIHAYLSRKELKAAKALFMKMQTDEELSPTAITILTMIDGISKIYNTTELHNFYRQLVEEAHIPISLDVYKRLIVAFGQHGDPTSANIYFRQMISKGIQPDTAIYTSLIGIFVDHKDLLQARALFEEMEGMNVPPSVATYHILIRAYRETKRNNEAEELYQHLISSGIPPNSSIYIAMGIESTKALEEMYKLGIVPSVRDFNTFMSTYIKRNDFLSASRLFQQMQDEVEPDIVSYSLVIDALIKDQQLERAFELYRAMKNAGLEPDVVLYTSLIQAFVQTSDLNGALNLLETMRDHQIRPNLYTFNTLLSVVSSRKILTDRDRDFAKAIFLKMKDMNTFPDVRTYNIMLSVLSKHIISTSPPSLPSTSTRFISQQPLHPNLTDMQSLYREMCCSSYASQPDFVTYSILINSFLDAGNIRFGTIIYNEMRSHRKMNPPVQIFNSLMMAYKKQGPASQIFSIWNDMRMARITPNNDSYDIVLEACQQYGHLDTLRVIQEQRRRDEDSP